MKILLVLLLSLSVPMTALSATLNLTKCEHRHAMVGTPSMAQDHAASMDRAPHSMHSQHLEHAGGSSKVDTTECGHCSSGHCASGSAALFVGGSDFLTPLNSSSELTLASDSHIAVAHSIGIFRPPNLI